MIAALMINATDPVTDDARTANNEARTKPPSDIWLETYSPTLTK